MEQEVDFDEEKVLQLLSKGSELAFTLIFDRYQKKVYSVAYNLLRSREIARDVVQEIFMKVWERRATFGDIKNLEAYILTCTKNKTINHFRKQSNSVLANYQYATSHTGTGESTENLVIEGQNEKLLSEAVEGLPPQQRKVFVLSRIEGLSHEAIAHQLNLSQNTINNHITAALKTIRQKLEPYVGTVLFVVIALLEGRI